MPEGVEVAQLVDRARRSEKSGPLTTRPASAASGETPESTSATSTAPPLTSSAPTAPRSASSVVLGVGGRVGGAAQHEAAVGVDGADSRSAAQRAQRAARHPGGEPAHERDLTFDTTPRPCTARSGPLPAPASSSTTTRRAALVRRSRGGREGEQDGEAQRAERKIPQRMAVRREFGHRGALGPRATSGQALAASAGACGSLWKLWRAAAGDSARSSLARPGFGQGVRKSAGLPMDRMCSRTLSKRVTAPPTPCGSASRPRAAATSTSRRACARARTCTRTSRASNGVPARLELLALHAGGRASTTPCWPAVDADLPRRLGDALRAATEPHGARAYRLDANLYAFLGPIEGGALTARRRGAARAQPRSPSASPPARSAARPGSPTRRPTATPRSRWPTSACAPARAGSACPPSARCATSCCRSSPSAAPAARPRAAARRRPRDRRRPPPRPRARRARRHRARRRDPGHRHARRPRGGAAQARDARARGVGA